MDLFYFIHYLSIHIITALLNNVYCVCDILRHNFLAMSAISLFSMFFSTIIFPCLSCKFSNGILDRLW